MSGHLVEHDRAELLGVRVSVITLNDAINLVKHWILSGGHRYICITGVHGVIESHKDPALRAIHNAADMVTPDGMPLVWLARRLGYTSIDRVYGPDLMRELTRRSPSLGIRHFYYGGGPNLADKLRTTLTAAYPGLKVVGTLSPPFRALSPQEDDAVVATINAAQPDILWVGLSTPKQERWMSAHQGRIDVPVMIGVGAAFDFLAGDKRQAPRWIGRSGLEWLFRLCTEPRRLWRRYFSIIPVFLALAARQWVTERVLRERVPALAAPSRDAQKNAG